MAHEGLIHHFAVHLTLQCNLKTGLENTKCIQLLTIIINLVCTGKSTMKALLWGQNTVLTHWLLNRLVTQVPNELHDTNISSNVAQRKEATFWKPNIICFAACFQCDFN